MKIVYIYVQDVRSTGQQWSMDRKLQFPLQPRVVCSAIFSGSGSIGEFLIFQKKLNEFQANRGATSQHINAKGCGFDFHSRKLNI